jgi:acyl-CoA synthetase (AMP-forming)/AMP-acid ligase II
MGKFSPNIIANYLGALARYNPAGDAILCGSVRQSYGGLAERVFRLAQALIRLGVKKDDKVTFMLHNLPEFIEINYAIQVAGAIPAPMNYRFTPREIEYQAGHSDAKVFFYHERYAREVEEAAPALSGIKTFVRLGAGKMPALEYEELVRSGENRDPRVPTSWDDVAVMIYTGGTTGFPKGVMLTYGAHLDMFTTMLATVFSRAATSLTTEQLKRVSDTMPVPGANRIAGVFANPTVRRLMAKPGTIRVLRHAIGFLLSRPQLARVGYKKPIRYMTPSMPFFHDASYQILILAMMTGNITFVLTPDVKFDTAAILKAVQDLKPAFMANVPTGWKKLVSEPRFAEFDVSSLRVCATGAGACPVALKKKIFERFPGAIIMDMFGQTEMTPITSFRIDADPSTLKERSVGKSIFPVRIVDEFGKEVAPGQIGEILYLSNTVMKGYYKDEGKTAETMTDGWFRSGDLGYIDAEGEVRLVDRKNECINTGGEKVFPLEVEEVIHLLPKVEEVCIIGVPDEEWGSTVRAVVQLQPGERLTAEEIVAFCRDQLAGFKIPRSVLFVDELPLSAAGKVLRAKIREQYGK